MIAKIRDEVLARGISRLCHFTPSRNLLHIANGKVGILGTAHLEESERDCLNPTDLERFDGHKGHICCSIEYPNSWYLARARQKEEIFKDWVVLCIRPDYLWKEGVLFSPRNAAAGHGCHLASGPNAFSALFAPSIAGAYGKTFARSGRHLPCSPTDDQAEVLIPDLIALDDVMAVIVESEAQAQREAARLRFLQSPPSFTYLIAPKLFERGGTSPLVRDGLRPQEIVWKPQ